MKPVVLYKEDGGLNLNTWHSYRIDFKASTVFVQYPDKNIELTQQAAKQFLALIGDHRHEQL